MMAEFINANDSAIGMPFSVIKVIKYESGAATKISGYHKSKFIEALGL